MIPVGKFWVSQRKEWPGIHSDLSGRDMTSLLIVGSYCGGALATTRDRAKFVARSRSTDRHIGIFTSNGKNMATIEVAIKDRLISLGFNRKEQLSVVYGDGTVVLYDIKGRDIVSKSFIHGETDMAFCAASFWNNGTVILTNTNCLYVWPGYGHDTVEIQLDTAISKYQPLSMAAFSLPNNPDRDFSIYLGSRNRGQMIEVRVEGGEEVRPKPLPLPVAGVVTRICVGPSEDLLCCWIDATVYGEYDGPLGVGGEPPPLEEDDLDAGEDEGELGVKSKKKKKEKEKEKEKKDLSVDTIDETVYNGYMFVFRPEDYKQLALIHFPDTVTPLDMKWCGDDAIVAHWAGKTIIIGPDGSTAPLHVDDDASLHTEIDGCRLIGGHTNQFIWRVPDVVALSFAVAGTSPAAVLLEAHRRFEEQDPVADELRRELQQKGSLREGVLGLIRTASCETDQHKQDELIKAASYGQVYLNSEEISYAATLNYDTRRQLHVINSLQSFDIGIPITVAQFRDLGAPRLISMLIHRDLYFHAFRVAKLFHVNPSKIAEAWSICVIEKSDHEETDIGIYKKLEPVMRKMADCYPYVSVARFAADLAQPRREDLALKLLKHEHKMTAQVDLLVRTDQYGEALNQSVQSLDTDLLSSVMKRFTDKHVTLQDMASHVSSHGDVSLACMNISLIEDPTLCRDLCDRVDGLGAIYGGAGDIDGMGPIISPVALHFANKIATQAATKLAYNEESMEAYMSRLGRVIKSKDRVVSTLAQYQAILVETQHKYEATIGKPLVGLSAYDTLFALLTGGQLKPAQTLKQQIHFNDTAWKHIQIKSFVSRADWAGLKKHYGACRSKIGPLPFFKACFEASALKEARGYAVVIPDPIEKLSALLQLQEFHKTTLEVAFQVRDPERLLQLQAETRDSAAINLLQQVYDKMQQK
ncbi:Vacuolar protein sorting-associated protein 16 like protein [Aduncisulcus paluster]|uniref:Vacuolar protein sorting-associated protein 16 like protein n=1 Tax=Aduncisulcus paluster TaxID=2918883 RepID=A0ABQ5K0J9_9EUKA|nr:Vacuolar protein sorting-associated protein 16 like protein [Aduncisulcus paluster]